MLSQTVFSKGILHGLPTSAHHDGKIVQQESHILFKLIIFKLETVTWPAATQIHLRSE